MTIQPTAVPIAAIRTDGGTQPRASLDLAVVADYATDMRGGATFPPVTVFYDGADYWLADGFHRLQAAAQIGRDAIDADVRQGGIQDAQWHSYGVNQSHGLRRTNEDKRRAVEAALRHSYNARYSVRQIAEHCGVSHMTVQRTRETICNNVTDSAARTVTRNGTTYTMNTANIGRTAPEDGAVGASVASVTQDADLPFLPDCVTDCDANGTDDTDDPYFDEPLTPHEAQIAAAYVAPPRPALVTVEQCDATAHLADGCADLILTDPPYGISAYGGVTKVGSQLVRANFDGDDDTWDSEDPIAFLETMRGWVSEWSRLVRPGGGVVAFTDRALISHLWDMLKVAGMTPKNIIVWTKTNPSPAGLARKNLISATEFMVWAVKPGAPYTFNRVDGWDGRNVIVTPIIGGGEKVDHPTQKPLAVLRPLIAAFSEPDALILDPFAGSGSTGVAAAALRRRAYLIERKAEYAALARERTSQVQEAA